MKFRSETKPVPASVSPAFVKDDPRVKACDAKIGACRAEIDRLREEVKVRDRRRLSPIEARVNELRDGVPIDPLPSIDQLRLDIASHEAFLIELNDKRASITQAVSAELMAPNGPNAVRHAALQAAVCDAAAAVKVAFDALTAFEEELVQRGINWQGCVTLQLSRWPELRYIALYQGLLDRIAEQRGAT